VKLSRQFQSLPSKSSQSGGLSHDGSPHSSSFSRTGALALLSAHEHLQFLEGACGGTEQRSLAGHAASSSQEAPSRDQPHAYAHTLSRISATTPVRLSGTCLGASSAPISASPTVPTLAHIPVFKQATGARVGKGHFSDRKGGAGSVWESAYDTLEEDHEAKSVVHVYAGDSDPAAEKAELKSCEGGGMGVNGVGSAGNERGNGSRRCLSYFLDTQVSARAKVE
jgi:hypothetical protein